MVLIKIEWDDLQRPTFLYHAKTASHPQRLLGLSKEEDKGTTVIFLRPLYPFHLSPWLTLPVRRTTTVSTMQVPRGGVLLRRQEMADQGPSEVGD